MAKIILAIEDDILQEIVISKERITIGRRAHNDIVIDDIAVSGEHAVIVTSHSDSVLEDLNSTNGTQVNGQPVKQHFLQNQDAIQLARYTIRYIVDTHDDEITIHSRTIPDGSRRGARIRVLNGANAGKEVGLTKALTTIGRPGKQVAVVTQRPQGYCITHVQGESGLLINGQPPTEIAHLLANGDVIDLAGTQTRFLLG
jgi:pSer/pThr/pTyr-binding forkhead associated (FHA) protein